MVIILAMCGTALATGETVTAETKLASAGEPLKTGVTPDAVLSVAEAACSALGELTGRSVKDDIITDIFSRFCVGK